MLPLKDCRGYRSRYINALNRAVRALTPIAGRGIRLRQSAQGVVIESTAKGGGAKASPFRHRWQVTATSEVQGTSTVWTLHVAPGSVWERDEEGALKEAVIAPETPVQADADAGGWKVSPAASGTLYVSEDKDGAKTLRLGNADDEEDTVLVRIAEIALTTGDPPECKITQRQVGDLVLAGEGKKVDPVAWRVERREVDGVEQWQVFSPLWCVGRDTLLPTGMARGWNALAVTSGTLYAALTWTGTATASGVMWTPDTPTLTNSIAGLPADDDPVADDPSTSTIEGKPGHRTVAVEIGSFLADGTFRQAHAGVIVEAFSPPDSQGLPDGAEAWGKVEVKEERDGSTSSGGKVTGYKLYQHKQAWDAKSKTFADKPNSRTLVGSISLGDSGGGLPDGTLIPGAVEYIVETNTSSGEGGEPTAVRLVQHYLKWDAASSAFIAAGEESDVVITELTSHAEDHAVQEERAQI